MNKVATALSTVNVTSLIHFYCNVARNVTAELSVGTSVRTNVKLIVPPTYSYNALFVLTTDSN